MTQADFLTQFAQVNDPRAVALCNKIAKMTETEFKAWETNWVKRNTPKTR